MPARCSTVGWRDAPVDPRSTCRHTDALGIWITSWRLGPKSDGNSCASCSRHPLGNIGSPRLAIRLAAIERRPSGAEQCSGQMVEFTGRTRRNDSAAPMHNRFDDGVDTIFGRDRLAERDIEVRFVWSDIGSNTARWEQAFSPDGATWKVNWVMHIERQGVRA